MVTAPDGSVNTTVLAGEKTTVTDPDGKTRVLWTDALGRLARVTEDPGGTKNFDTYYLYDALDDLAGVCPGSPFSGSTCSSARKRTFYYDSLKRLRRAENPESVSADYTYDDNGSLLTRADPRYTTTYGYDELNRMTGKSYSTGGGNPVTLCYDSAAACAGATVANGMGRLIHVSNGASKTRYNSFDQMGRVLRRQRRAFHSRHGREPHDGNHWRSYYTAPIHHLPQVAQGEWPPAPDFEKHLDTVRESLRRDGLPASTVRTSLKHARRFLHHLEAHDVREGDQRCGEIAATLQTCPRRQLPNPNRETTPHRV